MLTTPINKKDLVKEELKSLIEQRTRFICNDCRSFLWLRLEHQEIFQREELRVGGGNVLMAIGLLTTLAYLCKIYGILKLGKRCPRNKDKNKSVNETDAFVIMIHDYPDDLGLSMFDGDLREFWNEWRNSLAHLIGPKGVAEALETNNNPQFQGRYFETTSLLQGVTQVYSFYKKRDDPWWYCNVDKLTADVGKIAAWLSVEVDKQQEEAVTYTLNWLKTELGYT